MWFRRRRRRLPPPVLLPSLDRLAELIERVVELLDGLTSPAQAAEELASQEHEPATPVPVPEGWVAFLATPAGYRIVQLGGCAPARGEAVEVEGGRWTVLRLGPSPLPGDGRRCAYLEREERPAPERTSEP